MFGLKKSIGAGTIAFVQNAGQLFGATTFGQGISLILAPIVARIYGPEPYGVAAVLIAIAGFATILATVRYEQAIVVAKESNEAISLLQLCLVLVVGFTLISYFLIGGAWVILDERIEGWLGSERRLLFLLPLLVLLTSLDKIFKALQTRLEGFGCLGRAVLVTSIMVPSSRIGIGSIASPSAAGLIFGSVIGVAASVTVLGSGVADYWRNLYRRSKFQEIWVTAKSFRDFPQYSAPTEMLNNVSAQLPLYVLAFMYTPAVVGYYAIAMRLVSMPVQTLGNSVRQAYYQKCAEKRANGDKLMSPLRKITGILIVIGAIPFGALFFYGKDIFSFVLGESWAEAGDYASILAPWLFTALIIVPYQVTMTVIRRQEFWFRFQIYLMALRIGSFVVAYKFALAAQAAIGLFVATSFIFNVILITVAFRIISKEDGG